MNTTKNRKKKNYEAPSIEIIRLQAEQGMADIIVGSREPQEEEDLNSSGAPKRQSPFWD